MRQRFLQNDSDGLFQSHVRVGVVMINEEVRYGGASRHATDPSLPPT